jgi:hypothetical protein
VGEDVVVEAVDVFDAEGAKRDVADAGVDVVVDHPLVAVDGGGAELWPASWHPMLG